MDERVSWSEFGSAPSGPQSGGIKLVTDSTADIPDQLLERHGIFQLPVNVRFGSRQYIDRRDISVENFFDEVDTMEGHPATSAVAPANMALVFKELLQHHPYIIKISMGAGGSVTHRNALRAAKMLDTKRIFTIDSRCHSAGFGLITLHAATLIEKGLPVEDVVERTKALARRAHSFVTVSSLEYLKRGGRLSPMRAAIGNLINARPIISLHNGVPVPLVTVRGSDTVITRFIDIMRERAGKVNAMSNGIVAICHNQDDARAQRLAEAIESEFAPKRIVIWPMRSVAQLIHAGPGCLGLHFFT